ncbi:KfrB domain-containing protein [Glaciimonas sp. GG7]
MNFNNAEEKRLPNGALVVSDGRFIGSVIDIQNDHVIQDTGRGNLVAHDLANFETPPNKGDKVDIAYKDGLAKIVDPLLHDNHSVGVAMNTR